MTFTLPLSTLGHTLSGRAGGACSRCGQHGVEEGMACPADDRYQPVGDALAEVHAAGEPSAPVERIIKPDAVRNGLTGTILSAAEQRGFVIRAMKRIRLDLGMADRLYAAHRGRPYFEPLCAFMTSGWVVVAVLERAHAVGRWRALMGATDSSKAAPGTFRHAFGSRRVVMENLVHGSDSVSAAAGEIGLFFPYGAGEIELAPTSPKKDSAHGG